MTCIYKILLFNPCLLPHIYLINSHFKNLITVYLTHKCTQSLILLSFFLTKLSCVHVYISPISFSLSLFQIPLFSLFTSTCVCVCVCLRRHPILYPQIRLCNLLPVASEVPTFPSCRRFRSFWARPACPSVVVLRHPIAKIRPPTPPAHHPPHGKPIVPGKCGCCWFFAFFLTFTLHLRFFCAFFV